MSAASDAISIASTPSKVTPSPHGPAPTGPRRSRASRVGETLLGPWRLIRAIFGLAWNPILAKELRVSSRRKRTYVLRALYLLVLLAVMLLMWMNVSTSMSYYDGGIGTGVAQRLQTQSRLGEALSITLGWFQIVALILVAPMLTASCVSDEVEDRSLDVLLITPLSVPRIVVGKLLSRLVYVALLLTLAFPLLLAMRTYGGFELGTLLRIEALALTTAALGGAVGLLMSCWEARAWRAVVAAYFWLALAWFAVPLIIAAVVRWGSSVLQGSVGATASLSGVGELYLALEFHANPLFAMALLTEESITAGLFGFAFAASWWSVNLVNLLLAGLVLALVLPLVRRKARLHSAAESASAWPRFWRRRRAAKTTTKKPAALAADVESAQAEGALAAAADAAVPAPRADAQTLLETLPIPRVWDRPVLWREVRSLLPTGRRRFIVAALAIVGLLVWYDVATRPDEDWEYHLPIVLVGLFGQLVVAAAVAPGAFAQERQARTWDVLLCAPLKPSAIVWAKFIGALRPVLWPALLTLAQFLAFAIFDARLLVWGLHVALIGAGFSVFLIGAGLYLSLRLSRAFAAMAANFGMAIALWAVVPLLVTLLAESLPNYFEAERTAGAIFLINPGYWFGVATDGFDSLGNNRSHPTPYDLAFWRVRLSTIDFTLLLAGACAGMAAIGLGLVGYCAAAFNRMTGRPS